MTEKEKMLQGILYDANELQLVQDRNTAKDLCYEFNHLRPSAVKEQEEIFKKLIGKIHGVFSVMAPFYCDYGYNIEIGDHFFANHNTVILDCAKVTFGKYVFIAPNCGFYTAGHPIDTERRNEGLEFAHPITVGDNVWIGAGSVVNKDIPNNCVAVGNPCRVIRPITEEDRLTAWEYKK